MLQPSALASPLRKNSCAANNLASALARGRVATAFSPFFALSSHLALARPDSAQPTTAQLRLIASPETAKRTLVFLSARKPHGTMRAFVIKGMATK